MPSRHRRGTRMIVSGVHGSRRSTLASRSRHLFTLLRLLYFATNGTPRTVMSGTFAYQLRACIMRWDVRQGLRIYRAHNRPLSYGTSPEAEGRRG